MRNVMKEHIDKGGEGLSPLFLEAMADYFKGPEVTRFKGRIRQVRSVFGSLTRTG